MEPVLFTKIVFFNFMVSTLLVLLAIITVTFVYIKKKKFASLASKYKKALFISIFYYIFSNLTLMLIMKFM